MMREASVCRREGHDWQLTEVANVQICPQCHTTRRLDSSGRLYQYQRGHIHGA